MRLLDEEGKFTGEFLGIFIFATIFLSVLLVLYTSLTIEYVTTVTEQDLGAITEIKSFESSEGFLSSARTCVVVANKTNVVAIDDYICRKMRTGKNLILTTTTTQQIIPDDIVHKIDKFILLSMNDNSTTMTWEKYTLEDNNK